MLVQNKHENRSLMAQEHKSCWHKFGVKIGNDGFCGYTLGQF